MTGEGDILLVDSDEEARDVMLPFLRRCGPVRTAPTRREGAEALAKDVPAVLVLDPALSDGDGLGLIRDGRARRPAMQSLVVCSPAWMLRAGELIAAGASDVTTKPFDVGGLAQRITRLQRAGRILREEIARREQLEERLAHAERVTAVGVAAATMAHEITNPLSTVAANAAYLRGALERGAASGDAALDEMRSAVAGISRASGMIETFVNRVRRFSARSEQPHERASIVDAVQWTLQLARARAAAAQVHVEPPAGDAPVLLHEPVRLTQALLNAVTNAVDAAGPGGRVVLSYVADEGLAGVRVEDDGPGASDEVLARMGEPFFTTKQQGTGLGLAVLRDVANEHGGRLAIVRRAGGRGLSVTLLLPR